MPKLIPLNTQEAQKLLSKRLQQSRNDRGSYEIRWEEAEAIVYRVDQRTPPGSPVDDQSYSGPHSGPDYNDEDITVGYCFKNLRFIHAQLSANPPSVTIRPATNDQSDRQRADAADRLVRHFIRAYNMQEHFDQMTLNTLLYGTGFLKILWDPHEGEVLDIDEDGELTMEGDISISTPSPWDIFVDPDAERWSDVRYVFHRLQLDVEEAMQLYPDHAERFKQMAGVEYKKSTELRGIKDQNYSNVEMYEYWEKGMTQNGFLGRYCVMLEDGTIIEPMKDNPCFTQSPHSKIPKAHIPFYPLTDVDIPNRTWGRSFVEWAGPLQDTLNKFDTAQLSNMQAHGKNTLVVPEIAEVEQDGINNDAWNVMKVSGNQSPYFLSAPPVIPQMDTMRGQLKIDGDEMAGVNDAMLGNIRRETAGTAMQYAVNQGNMIRRRLFNKYVAVTEAAYKSLLEIVRQNWDLPKKILILGTEKSFEAVTIGGADIQGGFDLVVEYGTTLSLDPSTRREEIITLSPLLEKAGIDARKQIRHLKLNEVEGLHDAVQMAEDRQREIFEKMILTGELIPPREFQDHINMLAWSLDYAMTKEFDNLKESQKKLIEEHIRLRKQAAAAEQSPAPGPAPAPGPGAAPTGAPEQPMDISQLLGQG